MEQIKQKANHQDQMAQGANDARRAKIKASETYQYCQKAFLPLRVGAIAQLLLFGMLASFVFFHPLLPLDILITHSFQQNQSSLLRISMLIISYAGSSFLLPTLVLLTVILFLMRGYRLEAAFVVGLSACSLLLNLVLKVLIHRPRPSGNVVHIIVSSVGYSFPSGHVMAYVAYWGLLFAFGIILFRGRHWWRTALLIVSAASILLIGPSRVYLGDHWASDVIGAYLIGGVLWDIAVSLYLILKERILLTPGHMNSMQPIKSYSKEGLPEAGNRPILAFLKKENKT